MVWAAILQGQGFTTCYIDGKITAEDYQNVLEETYLPWKATLRPEPYIFQQDNAPVHSARSTKDWLADHDIETLPWPARSPDLNPVENFWAQLSRYVYADGKQYTSVEELQQGIYAASAKITVEYINSLYESMPRRMQAVIDNKGAITDYKTPFNLKKLTVALVFYLIFAKLYLGLFIWPGL